MSDHRKQLARLVGALIGTLSLLFIGFQLRQAWPQIVELRLDPSFLVLALVCGTGSLSMYAVLWRSILQQGGDRLHLATAVRIWFLSQIVRYIPGNIWHFMGRAYLTRQEGISTQAASFSMIIELLQTFTAALIVAAISLLFRRQYHILDLWVLLLVPLLVCYVWPTLLTRPIVWAMRRVHTLSAPIPLQRNHLIALLPGYCLTWLLYGCGLFLLVRALYPLTIGDLPVLTGMFAIAWVVGFLSFITPSGLGVREGVLGALLSLIVPTPIALVLALLARVWLTLAEVMCAAVCVLWRKR